MPILFDSYRNSHQIICYLQKFSEAELNSMSASDIVDKKLRERFHSPPASLRSPQSRIRLAARILLLNISEGLQFPLFWSLSHKNEMALVGVGRIPFGLDVEYRDSSIDYERILRRVGGDPSKGDSLCQWTALEASLKAERYELALISDYEVLEFAGMAGRVRSRKTQHEFSFTIECHGDLVAALAFSHH